MKYGDSIDFVSGKMEKKYLCVFGLFIPKKQNLSQKTQKTRLPRAAVVPRQNM
jgi:hypothetical protein